MRRVIATFLAAACLATPAHAADFAVVHFAKGLENPWGMDVLPDGRLLVTERPGRLRIIGTDGILSAPLAGMPAVFAEGQGGLLDVARAPDFASSKRIYFSYAEPGADGTAGTAVAYGTLAGEEVTGVKVVFRQQPKVEGGNHFGSRLAFAPDGNLFITTGERWDHSDKAQTLDNHMGKLIRITPEGGIPADNPYADGKRGLPEIYSYGHRNMQGAAIHPASGTLWIHEHGARGGDEINIPVAGGNFGWPEASYGSHYTMLPIPDDHAGKGFIEPIHHWTPSIAPSGMWFYTGDAFPDWRGDLFVGALAGQHLAHLELEGESVIAGEKLLTDLGERIRDVGQDAEGNLLVLTDSDEGEVLKLVPKP